MKTFLFILFLFSSILSYSQVSISDLMINNGIGQTKDQIYQMRKNYDVYTDTLNNKSYDVIRCGGKALERFFLTNIENKKDTQYCFHYRMIVVTGTFSIEKLEKILNANFKKSKKSWLQSKDNIQIIWTLEQKDYLLILNASKQ